MDENKLAGLVVGGALLVVAVLLQWGVIYFGWNYLSMTEFLGMERITWKQAIIVYFLASSLFKSSSFRMGNND
jgi:uncharacterized membrane protein (Fun14 family)